MSCMKRFRMIAAPLAALALVAGCTTATPYQPLGATKVRGGYTNQQLDQTHWRVSFIGNSLTSREQVETYLLYRAAELTLEQGFNCFTLVDRSTDRSVRLETMPYGPYRGIYPGWSPYWHIYGPWGWHYYDPWLGGPFFPGRYDIRTIESFQATADIALVRAPCPATPRTFNAAQIVQNLRPRIVLPTTG